MKSIIPDSVYYALKSIAERYCPGDEQYEEEGMSERGEKRKIEFIESYWTGGELGSDYQWSDNHGELVRCRECIYWQDNNDGYPHKDCKWREDETPDPEDFCSAGERRDDGA